MGKNELKFTCLSRVVHVKWLFNHRYRYDFSVPGCNSSIGIRTRRCPVEEDVDVWSPSPDS